MLRRKRTIIQIPKDQYGMCCARAIVVGMAQLTSGMSRTGKTPWGQQVRRYVKLQVSLANALMSRAGIPVNKPCGLPEWEKFQAVLGKISLVVVSKDHFNTIVYYGGGGKVRGLVVALYLADGHYHTVTRLPTFLGVGYVCPDCFGSSVAARHHRCRYTCKFCTGSGKCQWEGDGQLCQDCKVVYPNGSCASRHVLTGVCGNRRTCSDCGKWYITKLASGAPGQHRCGHSYCSVCHVMMPKGHKCYMQPTKTCKDEFKTRHYIFYDFESMLLQDGQHRPNLCVLHRVCTRCMDLPMEEEEVDTPRCNCGRERKIFKGEDTVEQFGAYLFTGRLNGCICIAHNSSGYDAHFVLAFVHRMGIKPNLMVTGHKILRLEARGVSFIDSLNFFPMALSKLPEAFGLGELTKGFFPHLWNTLENQNYVGAIPDAVVLRARSDVPGKAGRVLRVVRRATRCHLRSSARVGEVLHFGRGHFATMLWGL